MKKLILFLFLAFPTFIFATEENETEMVKEIRAFYDGLDHSAMKTDYLFNRGFVILDNLRKWDSGMPIITNSYEWKFILECIINSKISSNANNPINLDLLQKSDLSEKGHGATVTLASLNFKGEYIPDEKMKSHLEDKMPIQYQFLNLFAGNAMPKKVYSGNVSFKWSPDLYFSNVKTKASLEIDFSDSRGFIPVDICKELTINVEYDCVGEKSICFRLVDDADTLVSFSHINIKTLGNNPLLKSTQNINFSVDGLNYLYEEGVDGKLDKPVIIVEGFDILDDQDKYDLQNSWSSRTNTLKNYGYDVFYVDFDEPGLSLLDNADVIVDLIHQINNSKVGNYEGIYIGESMGGIVGRIALKSMENSGYDHQIGLFVPYDSPFKGAYVPEGIQWTLNDLYSHAGNLVLGSFITTIIGGLFNADIPSMGFLMSQLNSPAAMQMLARHYLNYSTHLNFRSYLDNLGYPSLSRNVAIVNGSNNATPQGEPAKPGNSIFDHNLTLGIVDYSVKAWYTKTAQDLVAKTGIFEMLPLPHWNYDWHNIGAGSQLFTNAPGSYLYFTYDELGYVGNVKFTFVPTVSAIDISNSIFDLGSFAYFNNNNNNNNNEDAIIANGLTPFDDIYIDGDNSSHTLEETFYGESGSSAQYFNSHEIMYYNMYLQNRSISHNRDFEASNSITVGSNTQPWGNAKHQDTGDFVVNSGTNVNMVAGQSIKLSSGFKLQSGATFKASVDPDDPTLKSTTIEKLYAPSIIGNKYVSDSETYSIIDEEYDNISWVLIGNNINYSANDNGFSLPGELKNGQYTLICTCDKKGQKAASSKIIVVGNSIRSQLDEDLSTNINNIKLYPNPTKGIVSVKFEGIDVEVNVIVRDPLGKVVVKYNSVSASNPEIDLSALHKGLYFVDFISNSRNKLSTQKIIKQ